MKLLDAEQEAVMNTDVVLLAFVSAEVPREMKLQSADLMPQLLRKDV